MGYLFDNVEFGQATVECPPLYTFALTVRFARLDRFMPYDPADVITAVVKDRLPDVEDWQLSVLREDSIKLRFRTASMRALAIEAINAHIGPESDGIAGGLGGVSSGLKIIETTIHNPPD